MCITRNAKFDQRMKIWLWIWSISVQIIKQLSTGVFKIVWCNCIDYLDIMNILTGFLKYPLQLQSQSYFTALNYSLTDLPSSPLEYQLIDNTKRDIYCAQGSNYREIMHRIRTKIHKMTGSIWLGSNPSPGMYIFTTPPARLLLKETVIVWMYFNKASSLPKGISYYTLFNSIE